MIYTNFTWKIGGVFFRYLVRNRTTQKKQPFCRGFEGIVPDLSGFRKKEINQLSNFDVMADKQIIRHATIAHFHALETILQS